MKTRSLIIFLVIVLLSSACAAKPAAAVGPIQINAAWAKAANNGENTAAFMVIKNTGSQTDRLVKAEFTSAKMVTLMTMVSKDGKMVMSNVDAIEIPAGGQVELKSGGFHVMFMGLSSDLKTGGKISLTLTFEKSGVVTFDLPVKSE